MKAIQSSRLLVGAFLLSAALTARGATERWNPGGAGGGNGTWNTGLTPNWNSGQTWTNGNDALFSGTGGAVTVVRPSADSLTFSASGPYLLESGTLQLTGSNVTANSDATISSTLVSGVGLVKMGAGTLTLTGLGYFGGSTIDSEFGTLAVQDSIIDGDSYIGNNAGSNGTVTVSGSGSSWKSDYLLFIGVSGTGTLLITNGGAVTNNEVYNYGVIGLNPGSSGTVVVSGKGSTWNTESLNVGSEGSGTLLISNGGAVSSGYNSTVGYLGSATVSGTGSTWTTEYPSVGGAGASEAGGGGLLRITSGGVVDASVLTLAATGALALGENATLASALNVDGGTVTLVDGQVQTVTFTNPVTVSAGSNLDFEVGEGSDQIAFSGGGTLMITGSSMINVYGISGRVTPGADVLIAAATSGSMALGNVYNSGNFSYSLVSTATSEDVIVTAAATPLTTAYWKGGQDNIWSILTGGTGTNWTTNAAGTIDPHLTPSATTDVIFSAGDPANEGNTVLGADMTIKSLLVSDTDAVLISGANPLGTNTLTISGTTGITIDRGAGRVTMGANVYLSGSTQSVAVENAAGLFISGSLGGSIGVYAGGSSAGPGEAGLLRIINGGSVSATQATIWDTGTLAFAGNGTLNSPLGVKAGTVSLVDGQVQTVRFTNPVTISAGSSLDFDVGYGSDQVALSGGGSLTLAGDSLVNLYGLTGLVTSGTDVLISAPGVGGHLSLRAVYNSGNFRYSLLSTATSEEVLVTAAATPLTTAYWKGDRDNLWSILIGGTATNWTTNVAGTIDPHLTPGATTNVIFSADSPANEGGTVLGADMTIKSLTVSDTEAVLISGANVFGTNTLTISGTTGTTGIAVNSGAGRVSIGADLYLGPGSETVTVNNAAGLGVTGDIGGTSGLIKSGTGTLAFTGSGNVGATVDVAHGTLAIQNGGAFSGGTGLIGAAAGSSSVVVVSGSGSNWTITGNLAVGYLGGGTLSIAGGGSVTNENNCWIGDNSGSSGTVIISGVGTTWTNRYNLFVGNSGTGTLLISNSGVVTDSDAGSNPDSIGNNAGSSGAVTVTGSGSTWTNTAPVVGNSGNGALVITNGGTVTSYTGFDGEGTYGAAIGSDVGGSGIVTVSGSGSTWDNLGDVTVGGYGTGTLLIANGGVVISGVAYYDGGFFDDEEIGSVINSTGSAAVSGTGSSWIAAVSLGVNGLLRIASGGSVTSPQSSVGGSGTLAFGENATLNGALGVSGGAVTLVDGQVQTVSLTGSTSISAGSTLDFEVGNGSDQIILSGSATFMISGTSTVNVVGLSGQVAPGIDVLINAPTSGDLSLGNVYNSGNFTYSLLSTATAEELVVTAAATPLTTACWKGSQDNLWSILVGGSATNWTTDLAGINDPHLTPGATTDVIFSANTPANEGDTVLGADMTIKSLTVSDTNAVVISGSDPDPWMGTDTLTISGSTGTTGITVNEGAGPVSIGANLYLSGSSQTITVNNAAGLAVSGNIGGSNGLIKSGTGALTLTGIGNFGGAPGDVEFGTLAIQNGGALSNGSDYIGENAGSNGMVTVSGTGSAWTVNGVLEVGGSGQGSLRITGGGAVSNGPASTGDVIGSGSGSSGSMTVSGAGSTFTDNHVLYVGNEGTGSLEITAGGAVSDYNAYIGYAAGSDGMATVSGSGSKWTNYINLFIGDSGSGSLTLTNGALVSVAGATTIGSAGTLQFDAASTFNTGSLAVNGGTLVTLGASTFAHSATLGAGGMNVNSGGFNSTFSGAFSGTGGLAKLGSGTLTLTGSSTYTGATAVNAGTLALTTASSHTASLGNTAISVASGATFAATLAASHFTSVINAGAAGSGTSGATLALKPGSAFSMAGDAIGEFNLRQEASFSGPAFTIGGASGLAPSLIFNIGNAATGPDSIDVTKTVTVLATGGKITIDALAGDTSLTARSYDLITSAGGFSGTDGNGFTLTDTTLAIDGTTYDLSLANSTTDDEVLTVSAALAPAVQNSGEAQFSTAPAFVPARASTPLVTTTAVPEPATTASLLWTSGLAAAWLLRRRRG